MLPAMVARYAVLLIVFLPSFAWAGPPFVTDDPEPVEYQHWEINNYISGTRVRDETAATLPGSDINYGILPDVQAHINVTMAADASKGEPVYYGYGDTELGVKYRFIHETDWLPQVAIYPLLELPTGQVNHSLGDGQVREFFPVWMQKSFGPWMAFGGAGYWNNTETRNYWFEGAVLERKITDSLTLGGELFHQNANIYGGETTRDFTAGNVTGFNLGGSYDLSENYHILFSAGQGIEDISASNQFSYYVALQLTY